jgi:glycosyltransferase involved in cell wall biosynthesis
MTNVSILIPCYNAERWIAQCIESALNQTYANKEVIVIDDGSTDGSLEIIKQYKEQIYWKTQVNQGGNYTRNRLLELSEGEWLQYLDADDYLLPEKIQHQMQYLLQVPSVDVVYSPSIFEYYKNDTSWQEVLPIPEPHDPWILLARWYLPQTGSPLWRKQAIIDAGGWKVAQPCCQEHELYLRLLISNKTFAYFESPYSVYRQWSEMTVCKQNKSTTYRYRLEILADLEQHLINTHQNIPARIQAINQSRFECARQIWLFDYIWALRIVKDIKQYDCNFTPSGAASPIGYSFIYNYFGFRVAETIGTMLRSTKHYLRKLKATFRILLRILLWAITIFFPT